MPDLDKIVQIYHKEKLINDIIEAIGLNQYLTHLRFLEDDTDDEDSSDDEEKGAWDVEVSSDSD